MQELNVPGDLESARNGPKYGLWRAVLVALEDNRKTARLITIFVALALLVLATEGAIVNTLR